MEQTHSLQNMRVILKRVRQPRLAWSDFVNKRLPGKMFDLDRKCLFTKLL